MAGSGEFTIRVVPELDEAALDVLVERIVARLQDALSVEGAPVAGMFGARRGA